MCKEAAVTYLCLPTKVLGVDGFRVWTCDILNMQQRFWSLRCRDPLASHAATRLLRIFFGLYTEGIVWALRTRSPVIPFDHSSVTLQLHFPGSSNRTVSISWKASYGAWKASQVCRTDRVIRLEFKKLLLKCFENGACFTWRQGSVCTGSCCRRLDIGHAPTEHVPATTLHTTVL